MNEDIKIKLKQYKIDKAKKREYEIRLKERYEDVGVNGISYGERSGQTYKISSMAENQAIAIVEAREKLEKLIEEKGINIERVENAMSILNEDEREVIDLLYVKGFKVNTVLYKLNRSYSRVKAIETSALEKMDKIINC